MDLQAVLEQTIPLTKEVGQLIKKEGHNFDRKNIEKKGFNDLVSYVDKQAEEQLVKGLSEILPEAGFITEEGTAEEQGEEYKWIIDPLDGTTNFLHTLPVFAVSIGLLRGEELVMGVVYEVNKDECFYAREGGKAYCNGSEIQISPVQEMSESLLATGFPYAHFEQMEDYLAILTEFMKGSHGLRRMGSAAVDLAYVACGRFEGFYEYGLKAWDVAGGAFIVQQAGGKVTDFKGGKNFLFGGQMLASNGSVHSEMQQVIQNNWSLLK
ncbi:inositol monophosphatase family protein [Nafulsella turpanensis]|uniref:inositol monophosphatase family protein n=1 Tax=Nafulsella turpanensis TaxID=1265690 RepID=UPI000344E36D|nr:inositol monophosphatase family protein [Nafulsella turpanensis]